MDGILIVDKPQGITSHDVVVVIRRRFKVKKVGHAGTLDPLATGVLVILIGKATKLSNRLINQDKEYEVVMTLGRRTDTGDADGRPVFEGGDFSNITRNSVEEALAKFLGHRTQVPPMTSAIKYKGKKLYELARKGIEVVRFPRAINITELKLLSFKLPEITFRVKCSKGTYVRVLCDEVGLSLGCGGYVSKIRRLSSGDFSIKDAVEIVKLEGMTRQEFSQLLKNENYHKFKIA